METKTAVPGIYKVTEGILINKDNEALEAYKKRKGRDKKLDALEEEILTIRDDMAEIKLLLRGLVK
jgi:hypothetical protein